jgi:DNA-binding CsgD family transcriptional regulator
MTPHAKHTTAAANLLAQRLRDAHTFVDVGLVVCAAARDEELDCKFSLLSSRGVPAITVEHVRKTGAFACTVPLPALTENIGTIRWASARPLGDRVAGFTTIAIHVVVRLTQLGHATCVDELAALTTRQLETAALAARGYTNIEIAEQLGVSKNTIKKHLGDVFARLHISNRTELALRFSRLPTVESGPESVRYVGEVRITRHVQAARR